MTGSAMPGRAVVADVVDSFLEVSVVGSFSRIGPKVRRALDGWEDPSAEVLRGRTVLVSGATSGLGLATAQRLATDGAMVVLLGRDPGRLAAAISAIHQVVPAATLDSVVADLSELDSVRGAAELVQKRHPRLDVVVHNAGTLDLDLDLTADGVEVTAQTHVVAPFLLTSLLLPSLVRSPDPRVIHVVSGGLYTAQLSVESLARPGPADEFDGVRTYARAKRAALVLVQEWARRTPGSSLGDIRFHAMHPGWADTAGLERSLPTLHRVLGPILRSPAEAIDTTAWLAWSPEARCSNGQLWLDRRRRRTTYLPGTSDPDGEAARLWGWVGEAAGVGDPVEAWKRAEAEVRS